MCKMMMSSLTVFSLLYAAHAAEHSPTIALDTSVWTFGVRYPDMTIQLGEALKLSAYFPGSNVVLVHTPASGRHFDQCVIDTPNALATGAAFTTIWSDFPISNGNPGDRLYEPPTCGEFWISCSVMNHCGYGQRFKVTVNNVDGSACASPCQDAACVTEASKPSSGAGVVHDIIPCASENSCDTAFWGMAAPIPTLTVAIGDTVKFTTAPFHDVATVPTLDAFSSCTLDEKTQLAEWCPDSSCVFGTITAACAANATCCPDSSCGTQQSTMTLVTYTWEATTAGDTFFVCSKPGHCGMGQKVRVTVTPATGTGTGTETASADTSVACSKQAHIPLAVIVLMLLNRQVKAIV